MKSRFVYGTLLVVGVVALLAADAQWWPERRPCVTLLITCLALVGWYELVGLFGWRSRAHFGLGLVGTAFFHALAWWAARPDTSVNYDQAATVAVAALVFLSLGLAVFRRDFQAYYRPAVETVVGVLLLGFLLSHVGRLYLLNNGPSLTLVFFVGIKGTDVAAFLVGKTWGKHRFLPVSPKKSVEGCLAALAWGGIWFGTSSSIFGPVWISPSLAAVAAGIILAAVAQMGDFAESLVKRQYDVKDSKPLIPELGGVLDLIDSLLFTGYLFWCLV